MESASVGDANSVVDRSGERNTAYDTSVVRREPLFKRKEKPVSVWDYDLVKGNEVSPQLNR